MPGQHFTPGPVAAFLWEQILASLPDASGRLSVFDPAAGEGALLAATQTGPKDARCCGLELDPAVAVNGLEYGVEIGDGLFDLPSGARRYDVVLANPPYGRASDLLDDGQWERLLLGEGDHQIWGEGSGNRRRAFSSRPLEQLFVERCLALVGPGGRIGLILPDGLLANRRAQEARDWILQYASPLLIVALPGATFRRPGLNAMAHLLILAPCSDTTPAPDCLVVQRQVTRQARLTQLFATLTDELEKVRCGKQQGGIEVVASRELAQNRWDAPFWHGRRSVPAWDHRWPVVALGEFIEHITYGPIVTGSAPAPDPEGVISIRQGDFTDWGIDLGKALRVAAGGPHDPERSRVRAGDLVMPRSGAGALGRNRVGVYQGADEANVGCFVDRIRLRKIDPFYVLLFLKSEYGWQQIRAVINGVGTPNISFEEIRSLRLPLLPPDQQEYWSALYQTRVLSVRSADGVDGGATTDVSEIFTALMGEFELALHSSAGTG